MTLIDQVFLYRALNTQSKELSEQIKSLKSEIEQEVKDNGDFSDDDGYAKMMTRKGGVSCKNAKSLHEQAVIWAESDDPTMQANGKTVLTYLTLKDGYEYLAVK